MQSQDGSCYIFTGGAPRSGTTLLQNMLDSHPRIFGGPEFLHLTDIIDLRNRFKVSIDKQYIEHYCSQADVDQEVKQMINRLLMPALEASPADFISEKTPGNVLVFCELAELYPAARFVEVVRDPRATVASLLKVDQRARKIRNQSISIASDARRASRYVQRCLRAGREASDAYPDRVITIRYERLVTKPANELARLCEFLDIEFSAAMLSPAEQSHAGEAAITEKSGEVWYEKGCYNQNPHAGSLEKWRESLAPIDQVQVCRVFESCSTLRRLGYRFSRSELSVADRVSACIDGLIGKVSPRLIRDRPRH
ncbi:MAG: sulfotransferase family protein [bacterium]